MPLPRAATTGALLIGTVMAAVGLNLEVIALNTTSGQSTAAGASGTAPTVSLPADGDAPPAPGEGAQLAAFAKPMSSSTEPVATSMTIATTITTTSATTGTTATTLVTTSATATSTTEPSSAKTSQVQTTLPEPTSTATSTAAATEYLTYEFDGIATVIVALHNGRSLEFWSATPVHGWAFTVEEDDPSEVKIKFRPSGGGDEAEFEVKWDDGRLKVKREY